jgi:hypothetical protein
MTLDILKSLIIKSNKIGLREILVIDVFKKDFLLLQKYLIITHKTYNFIQSNEKDLFKDLIGKIPVFIDDDERFRKYLSEIYPYNFPFENMAKKSFWR